MENAATDIVIRVPQNLYDSRIQDFIDYVEYKKTVSKSKATQEDVEQLMEEINDSRREEVKKWLKEKLDLDD